MKTKYKKRERERKSQESTLQNPTHRSDNQASILKFRTLLLRLISQELLCNIQAVRVIEYCLVPLCRRVGIQHSPRAQADLCLQGNLLALVDRLYQQGQQDRGHPESQRATPVKSAITQSRPCLISTVKCAY